ncbi:alpha-1,3-mannosyl-glycoprotein 4-beta-N-acetylglucosaminyltransferase A isoform X3 [Phlebotomus argentipes]|nr:alpha-1,3-mannosyl-glycoprotein 4-beta-N-acetylglucosaminyltransferase A isoform X3 [Phlebotomus argentipes]XP_059618457.1 alpha-1,3-mannosyl-glycoprotein 4-beta-N-acetylglucosaminyltransferase A isoform X3 [Phlebotomus argentipes]
MGLAGPPLRRRGYYFLFVIVVLVPLTILFLIIGPDLSAEQTLSQRVAEFQIRLQYLESMYRARQEDVAILSQYLGMSNAASGVGGSGGVSDNANITLNGAILDALSPEARAILRNMTSASRFPSTLRMPTAFHFLPHLLDDPTSLRPAFLMSKGRQSVSVVLGIPTVKREKQSYLLGTLHNLITNMNEEERNDTMILVFIGETDIDYVQLVAKQIEVRFGSHVESGLIEVFSPPAAYYPNLDTLRQTLNDPPERVKWRSKQNLDFGFLMTYAQLKGTFYVQLEDDILAKRGFITTMKNFALEKSVRKDPWFVLDFCQLGFIGKLFKSAELPWVITFIQMFYNDKPVDWLLEHLIYTKICNWEKDMKHCKQEKAKLWIHYKPSLFQHIGTTSSLKGKVQKLKDKQFGKIPTFYSHTNPKAQVRSAIVAYKTHTLQRAYDGETFFWGLLPQPGDLVEFIFPRPVALRKYLFRSGNTEHPSDKFYNTTIEILPAGLDEASPIWSTYNTTTDGFLIVGSFSSFGIAEGILEPKIGRVKEIRLHVHSDSENWAILSEEFHVTRVYFHYQCDWRSI